MQKKENLLRFIEDGLTTSNYLYFLDNAGFIGLVLANTPGQQPANDPHDSIYKIPANERDQTPLPETDHDYIQHKDKQDEFDWKLTKVRITLYSA